ncbi:hypothetical protein GCM10010176_009780 [Nonomuraea spiralis]|nr:hypothetical protein GCM10010176_009780 [Nonomuraea spiralis]
MTRQRLAASLPAVAASAVVIGVQSAARLTRPASAPRGLRIGGFLQLRWTLDRTAFWWDQNPYVTIFAKFP